MARKNDSPAIPRKAVRLETFDIQGHNGEDALDYASVFALIARCDAQLRREEVGDRIVAIPSFYKVATGYAFVAYAGTTDTSFLVLDLGNDREEIRTIETGKIIATRTVGFIDPSARRAVVQYVHTGVRAAQIAALFEQIAQKQSPDFANASIEFAPVPRGDFAKELAQLERIRSASIKVTRPNVDWDDFSSAAVKFGQDSGAQNLDITASAPRNGSLSRNHGIIEGIKEFVSGKGKNVLKAAIVEGFKGDNEPLTTLNLNRYIESTSVKVPLAPDGLPNTTAVIAAAADSLGAGANIQ